MIERRAYKRLQVISYIRVDRASDEKEFGYIFDLSVSGMRLRSKEPLEVGSTYQFNFTLPQRERVSSEITFAASAIWCKEISDGEFFESGIELVGITDDEIRAIENYIEITEFEERWLSAIKVQSV